MEAMLSTLQGSLDSRTPVAESIGVNDFLKEVWDDYNSPTTSSFVLRIGQCRSTASNLEEVGGASYRCFLRFTLPMSFNPNSHPNSNPLGNSADKLRHPRSDAYSAEVLLNKQQIWGGGACLHFNSNIVTTLIVNDMTVPVFD